MTKPINPIFVLGVMETEAWFLAEHTHFRKLNSNLTSERIKAEFGFDPSVDDMQLRSCPSDDLHSIYQLEGFRTEKDKNRCKKRFDTSIMGLCTLS